MSGADILTMDQYYWGRHITRWRGLYGLYERGLLENSAWRRLVQEDISALDHPFGRAWWYEIREWETTLPDKLVKLVDSLLVNHPGQPLASWVEALRGRTTIESEKIKQ